MPVSLASLLPTPLHPAIVHLPIALTLLVPVFAVMALVSIRRGARPMRAWAVAFGMFAALTASGWLSAETGESQEERVESVVPEPALDAHAEAADLFVWISAGVLGIAALGLLSTRTGKAARLVATAGSAVLLLAGYRVGHSGGALVYQYGAAGVYTDATGGRLGETVAAASMRSAAGRSGSGDERADDDDDDDDGDDDGDEGNASPMTAAPNAARGNTGAIVGSATSGATTPALQGRSIKPLP